ncbi:zinc finger E-box-binding homeobox 2-like isoform X37 [Pomacea canaliculata]|uniref:zinc finger E-box-binding homeobox 2-like isoform X37 n=1 Tax=Pomacea canaliculata TaxID=400727 RepID=UPI000D73C2E6|nr:zinc finger E-box-binding homeobox 2-like isoform X37 [Pomacea canaliculata]
MDEESASKFINALIKSVQTLCHGYVDFNNGVEIIGYINLSVDKGSSFDYVLKEKVCKNEENSTLFISNSFHAQPKPDKPVKAKNGQVETHISQRRHSVDTSESNQLSSAISSISTVLSGSHSQEKSRSIFSAKDSPASSSSSSSHHIQSTAKRKGEDDVNHDHPPKAANLSHESSSQHFFHPESSPHVSATSSPVDSKPSMSDVAGNVGESSRRTSTVTSEEMQPHIAGTMLPQTATVTSDANSDLGVNLASSVLERIDDQSNSEMQEKDDSDLDLEVTFIKEEYVEGERSACEFQNSGGGQYGRGPDQRASTSSDSMADTPLYPVALHTSAAAATFAPGSHEMAAMAQHYSGIPSSSLGIGAGPSTSHQPGPSGMRDWAEKSMRSSSGKRQSTATSASLHCSQTQLETKATWKWQCSDCSRTFNSQPGLHIHIRQHHLRHFKYVCEVCSQGFMIRGHFVGHMNKHNGIKPFQCPDCSNSYFHKTALQRHQAEACGKKRPK